jgi:hypothetical protein
VTRRIEIETETETEIETEIETGIRIRIEDTRHMTTPHDTRRRRRCE